jgi:hypothetical protein
MKINNLICRRDALACLGAAGGLAAFGLPRAAFGADPALHRHDWDWLVGNWNVSHRRLRERLANSDDWQEFGGKSALWLVLDGLGTIDDNIIEIPGGSYRGLTVRTYDPASDSWAIRWIDGRDPSIIDPPVIGGFSNGEGVFTGSFTFKDRPITARFRWHDVHSDRPNWDQAFSTDGGQSWEINWRNWFTRTSAQPSALPLLANAPDDFAFLAGRWNVRHRKRRKRLVGSQDWDEFGGTFVNWPVLGGAGNVGDNVMLHPAGTIRGIGLRTFDPRAGTWSSWWFDGRNPHALGPALRGAFSNEIGTFVTEDTVDGRPVLARATWSRITSGSPRWEQSFSVDRGTTWEIDWTSDFTRAT